MKRPSLIHAESDASARTPLTVKKFFLRGFLATSIFTGLFFLALACGLMSMRDAWTVPILCVSYPMIGVGLALYSRAYDARK